MKILSTFDTANLPLQLRLPSVPRSIWIFSGALVSLCLGMWLIFHGSFHLVAAAIYLTLFLLIGYWNKQASLYVVALYTYLLGDLRRILDITGEIPKMDAMLLVSPLFALCMALPILMGVKLRDPIQKAVLGLMAIMSLEIVNPKQGALAVGLGGAMFYLVPLLWFWLGWRYGSLSLLRRLLYGVLIPLGVLAAIFGIIQTYIGYLPWEQVWLDEVGSHIHAMYLGNGVLRAVGFSVNGVEFTSLLMTSIVASFAAYLAGKRPFLLLLPLLGISLFLASSRSSIIYGIFGMAIAWSVQGRNPKTWVPRLAFALIIGVGGLAFSVTHAAQKSEASGPNNNNTAAGLSTQHQVEGLAHPLDSKHSTAGLHSKMFLGGIIRGFTYPIGMGLGSATLASSKLGGDSSSAGSTEMDISDVFSSNGFIGGCLYVYIIFLITQRATYLVTEAPKELGLPIAGILACLMGNWLGLGRYGQTTWLWMVIGIICRYGSKTVPMSQADKGYLSGELQNARSGIDAPVGL